MARRNISSTLAVHYDRLSQLRETNPGRLKMPRSAAELLREARIEGIGRRASRIERFAKAWRKAAGNEIASASEVTSYKQGELRVTVSSQALAHELSVHKSNTLLRAVNEALNEKDRVACLRIRAGVTKKKTKDTGKRTQSNG
ncbi:MAG: DUF721 domain-containing protein [Planctomycetes bacterium]|nr:DUF721 domain-containing protein [Planctomycetota bacterium]NUQ33525.1 DUF721 domain-containing protein [Planctomycetaceae bacterium]